VPEIETPVLMVPDDGLKTNVGTAGDATVKEADSISPAFVVTVTV
jgi:hypothetical protein